MLRITNVQEPGASSVLKLEGKLLEPWVGELHDACRECLNPPAVVTLDVAELSFVDAAGTIALRELQRCGFSIRGCSSLVAELLKEMN